MIRKLRSIFNPDMFQGWGRRKRYFEGWYFKIVSSSHKRIYAIIPGVSMDEAGNKHAFIQVLDGIYETSEYFTFPYGEFKPDTREFRISVADNHFSNSGLRLDLPDFKADLSFIDQHKWPNRWYAPGIMGPYTFAPFMECNHGVLSMTHSTAGHITHNNKNIDFAGGAGYTEKDWGHSFPRAYIWMQSNHFGDQVASLKMSIANIPWLRKSFTGFIAGFLYGDRLYEFTTYNSSKLVRLEVSLNSIVAEIANNKYSIHIEAQRSKAVQLASPISGEMSGHIMESMRSVVALVLRNVKTGSIIFSGRGINTALEVAGEIKLLLT